MEIPYEIRKKASEIFGNPNLSDKEKIKEIQKISHDFEGNWDETKKEAYVLAGQINAICNNERNDVVFWALTEVLAQGVFSIYKQEHRHKLAIEIVKSHLESSLERLRKHSESAG